MVIKKKWSKGFNYFGCDLATIFTVWSKRKKSGKNKSFFFQNYQKRGHRSIEKVVEGRAGVAFLLGAAGCRGLSHELSLASNLGGSPWGVLWGRPRSLNH